MAAHGREVTQNQLGALAKIAPGMWSQLETGAKPITPATLDKIAAMFKSAGMPYVTRPWLDYGVTLPGDLEFPVLLTGPIEIALPWDPEVAEQEQEGVEVAKRKKGRKVTATPRKTAAENPRKRKGA